LIATGIEQIAEAAELRNAERGRGAGGLELGAEILQARGFRRLVLEPLEHAGQQCEFMTRRFDTGQHRPHAGSQHHREAALQSEKEEEGDATGVAEDPRHDAAEGQGREKGAHVGERARVQLGTRRPPGDQGVGRDLRADILAEQ